MINNRTTSRRKSLGQGMTEYIIIVALIAVAAIGVYSFFGKTVRNQTAGMAKELAGQNSDAQIKGAGTAAQGAATEGNKQKDLGTYGNNQGK